MNLSKLFKVYSETIKKKELELNAHELPSQVILDLQGKLVDLGREINEKHTTSSDYRLLETYLDVLEIMLSIGILLEIPDHFPDEIQRMYSSQSRQTDIDQVLCIMHLSHFKAKKPETHQWSDIFCEILGLGEMLGIDWGAIEQELLKHIKEKEKHERLKRTGWIL